ncbi:MAG: translocation/assembly module TamB domain-containing protein [Bacteroidota bacterium]
MWVVWITAVLLLSIYGLLHLPAVQTWATRTAMNYFSKQLHTKITIKSVDIAFYDKVVLEGFYVEDLHHDTLLYAGKLKVSVTDFILKKSKFDINSVELVDTYFHLRKYKGEKDLNLQFILDGLKSNGPPDTTKSNLYLTCNHLELNNLDFTLIDENDTYAEHGLDFSNLHVKNISGNLNKILLAGDSITLKMKELAFLDQSGFKVNEITADVKFTPNELSFMGLTLKTPNSDIKGEYSMLYDSLSAFNDIDNMITMKSKFDKSTVSFKDIGYFEHHLFGTSNKIKLSGEIKGKITRLRAKNLDITFGTVSHFHGNINIDGLPNIDETFIDLSLDGLQTSKSDIERIEIAPFDKKHFVQLPDNLRELGVINLSGKFTGFINDFVAYGNLKTALGNVSSDINVKYDNKSHTTTYQGKIATNNFNLGRIIQQEPLLGVISINASVKGTSFPKKSAAPVGQVDNIINTLSSYFQMFNADLDATIDNMDLNGYNYKNIVLNGHASNRQFKGNLAINDENIKLDFDGKVDFSKDLPMFDFNSRIVGAKLSRLKLLHRDESATLSTDMSIHFTGNKLDNIYGIIELDNTTYNELNDTIWLDKLQLKALGEDKVRTIDLLSDVMDANIKGGFKFNRLYPVLKNLVSKFIPDNKTLLMPEEKEEQKFDFSIHLKNANEITKIFLPQLKIAPYTSFNGSFNSTNGKLLLTGVSPSIKYNKIAVKDFEINATTNNNTIAVDANTYKFYLNDSLWINDVQVSCQLREDTLTFQTLLQNVKNAPNHARLNGFVALDNPNKIVAKILPSEIVIENNPWIINSKNLITIDSSSIAVSDFSLVNAKQKIVINGKLSDKSNDKMNVKFSNFELSNFDELFKSIKMTMEGSINGDADLVGPMSRLHVSSALTINTFKINGDTLGNAFINSTWDDEKQIAGINVNVKNDNFKSIDITGNYYVDRKTDNLDFDIKLGDINLNVLNRLFDDIIVVDKGNKSKMDGALTLKGTGDNPILKGKLHLKNAGLMVKFLNTHYSFSNDVDVTEKGFFFNNLTILDDKGNKAYGSANITHKKFRDMKLDMTMALEKFQMLNTTEYMNDLFYGTAYASGNVSLKGPFENLDLKVAVKSERGTQINIPMNFNTEVSESDFITFVNSGNLQSTKKYEADFNGLTMSFDLEMTPDAEVQIIFDEKVGDKIKGNGSGNIKMDINTMGDFNMFGDYTIEKGNYLFTFQNITNKYFVIQPGGTIHWNGKALDAEINLNAMYSLNASLGDLIQDTSANLKKPYKVNVYLMMSGKLMAPSIKFDIEVPDLMDQVLQGQLSRIKGNEAEMNKQVFGLITFNKFFPPAGALGPIVDQTSAASNISQLLSSQFSNLTSQLIKNVSLGVNYHPAGQLTKQEADVLFSTQLFNDRLTINGNFGYATGTNQSTSNIVGDLDLNYALTDDKKIQLKVFNKTNTNLLTTTDISPYTQGVGLIFRKEFDNFWDLFRPNHEKKKTEPIEPVKQ